MSYVDPNYTSKKEFKAAVAAGVQHETYNPSGMFPVTAALLEAGEIRA